MSPLFYDAWLHVWSDAGNCRVFISPAPQAYTPTPYNNIAIPNAAQRWYGLHLRIINKRSYFTVKLLPSFRVNHFNNAVDVLSL